MNDLKAAMHASASGLHVQGVRQRIISENLANAASTGSVPSEDPYQRKVLTFRNMLDEATGAMTVEVARVGRDTRTDFETRYDPSHPAADENGYVKLPNVNRLVEIADMKEASLTSEALTKSQQSAYEMLSKIYDLLNSR
ncbi:flagellar basal body rod protein FlgC [Azospirillum sp. SYSU D00513]|uniref:flagellar basal body rod protein FlgC n=1 Tax=Azospirillum sp. SYSU D00513 TaxID=2812561 RepID=UPI001A96CF36|nr:flagellar basal body rod protein FlgC [Azospirillum sp. SYSU D00513]